MVAPGGRGSEAGPPTVATMHRQAAGVARAQGWPVPGYAAVYDVVTSIDPAMATLAHEGSKRYRDVFDLVYRREAAKPNEIWQADHTLLDLWVLTPSGLDATASGLQSLGTAGYARIRPLPVSVAERTAWVLRRAGIRLMKFPRPDRQSR